MKRILIEDEGHSRPAFVDRLADVLWIHYKGQTYSIQLNESKSRRAHKSESTDTSDIFAPMPGKITQVLCKAGDKILKGKILIVMEAMKMEYNLKSSKDGQVESVEIKSSDQVQLGQLLVKIKAES